MPHHYKWRIYADHMIEREIVTSLKKADMDVLWVQEKPELRKQRDDRFHYNKAAQLGRYLLTRDSDFWDDHKYKLRSSPGVIILSNEDAEWGQLLVRLLRKLVRDVSNKDDHVYLDATKMRVSAQGIILRFIDPSKQKPIQETYAWSELYP